MPAPGVNSGSQVTDRHCGQHHTQKKNRFVTEYLVRQPLPSPPSPVVSQRRQQGKEPASQTVRRKKQFLQKFHDKAIGKHRPYRHYRTNNRYPERVFCQLFPLERTHRVTCFQPISRIRCDCPLRLPPLDHTSQKVPLGFIQLHCHPILDFGVKILILAVQGKHLSFNFAGQKNDYARRYFLPHTQEIAPTP